MIGPWTQETVSTWFRRDTEGKARATIVVSPEGAFATVVYEHDVVARAQGGIRVPTSTRNTGVFRLQFPDVEKAKTWCDDVLAGRVDPRPSQPPRGPPPPLRPPATAANPSPIVPEPKPPAGPPVERLLRVLRNDPVLAFEVAQKLRILGPWTQEGEDWHQRADAYGYVVATVRGEPKGTEILWRWSTFHHAPAGEEDRTMSGFGSWEEARGACDVHLAGEGWLLVPWTPRTEARP